MTRSTCLSLVVCLSLSPLLADEVASWKVTSDVPVLSEEVKGRRFDTFGTPEWGVSVSCSAKDLAWFESEAGTGYFEAEPGSRIEVRIVDIDATGYDPATDGVEVELAVSTRDMVFPDGSRVTVTLARFYPEGESGPDASPRNARRLSLDARERDSVSYVDGDRTDHYDLAVDGETRVEGYVFCRDGGLSVDWVRDGAITDFNTLDFAGSSFWFFRGRVVSGGTVIRVRARTGCGARAYEVLVARVGERGEGEGELVKAVLDTVAAGGTGAANLSARSEGTRVLRALESEEARAALLRGLEDGEGAVRWFAAGAVGEMKLEAALGRLERMAAEDPSEEARRAAASAVKRIQRKKR